MPLTRIPKIPILIASAAIIIPSVLIVVLPFIRPPPRRSGKPPPALPKGVKRIATPRGLELFVSTPEGHHEKVGHHSAPILHVHGGFGSAYCFIEWLPYIAKKGRVAYSLSLSGHGLSPRPSNFVRMRVGDFATELEAAIQYIQTLHPNAPPPVLIGHSAGGGLAQYTVANTSAEVSGLICVAAFPPYGGFCVYSNWYIADPWALPRMLLHGGNTKSPLSSPALVRQAFFGPDMTKPSLDSFFPNMNPEESAAWPMSMMFSFVDPEKVKQRTKGKVLWIGGEKDVLMTPKVMKDTAKVYQTKVEFVKQAGHHLMRDAHWQAGADIALKQLREWNL